MYIDADLMPVLVAIINGDRSKVVKTAAIQAFVSIVKLMQATHVLPLLGYNILAGMALALTPGFADTDQKKMDALTALLNVFSIVTPEVALEFTQSAKECDLYSCINHYVAKPNGANMSML